jgi:NAD dependent epimerase/dehydratase
MPAEASSFSWSQARVFVTGAAGFIGSHLCDALAEQGASVTALVKYSSSGFAGHLTPSPLRARIQIVYGNVEDAPLMLAATRDHDVIFHLAALIGIPYSYAATASYVATNISGTLNILNAARANSPRRVVVTSTSECYGTARYAPIDEQHPLQGQSPYSASKIGADKLAESFHLSFGIPVATIRPFNTFGPRQSARAVIPSVIAQALAGGTVKVGSLTPLRDFNYVSDTVSGFLRVAESDAAIGEVINIGSGREVSIGEIVDRVKTLVGRDFPVETDDARVRPEQSEVMRLLCDRSKAERLLGWAPQVSLEDGLKRTVDYIRDHLALYQTERYAV